MKQQQYYIPKKLKLLRNDLKDSQTNEYLFDKLVTLNDTNSKLKKALNSCTNPKELRQLSSSYNSNIREIVSLMQNLEYKDNNGSVSIFNGLEVE
ncbi:hypothetical protein ACSW9V_00670 [Clostridium perfringens]|uniref:hypothetical protein n=1 Tax=Clostridium perfringens TaxID=1502 RepID=UPI000E189085|nr:hypothetical protein [Clostridium perfringens]ELC8351686.1 hypothetical protein [Clostridium perfringens]MDK0953138.1 hypothetical protein [Clostridium perfringens]SUY42070.1 Uncharacterised protein [Clostridium perfringens]HAT4142881.1 hypothetical protein [Clostridium perfringens]